MTELLPNPTTAPVNVPEQDKDTDQPTIFGMTDEELAETGNIDFAAEAPREKLSVKLEPNPQSDDWPNPQPIKVSLLSVLSVSPSMIPEPVRPWLTDIAHRMKCPLDYVASAFVVMISSLIGTRLAIKPKTRDDWSIVPNLWGAMIGDPSMMKTPAANEVFKPLKRLVTEERSRYETAVRDYEFELVEYEAQKKAYASQALDRAKGKKVDTPVSRPEPPVKPIERRFMTNDATIEKIGELLNENPTGLLQFRDELTGLLASFDRSGHEQDRAFFLEAWNGNGSMTIDRIGRGTTHVKNVCLSLFGGIQPSKLLGYLQSAVGHENDGLVQREQLAVYPDKPRWEYVDDFPDARARDRAFTLIQSVADADFSGIAYEVDQYNPYPFTRFDTDGQEIFKQWLIDWQTRVIPNENGLLLEHFAKYPSLIPSLALIFHVLNYVDGLTSPDANGKHLVSADAARMAVAWCTYLQSHARRIYGLLETVPVAAANELIPHLKAWNLSDGFKVRDVVRKGWTMLGTTETVEAAVSVLVSTGWLREIVSTQKPTGRPEAPSYKINPKILQKRVGH